MNLDYESPIMDVFDFDPPTVLMDSDCTTYTDPGTDIGCIVMYDESCPENCIADGIGCVTDCIGDGIGCVSDAICPADGLSTLG